MIENVILAIGTDRFSKVLFDVMAPALSLRQVVIHRYVSATKVEALAAEDIERDGTVQRLVDRYVRHYQKRDPLRLQLTPVRCREIAWKNLRPDEMYDEDYRRDLFRAPGIVGKLSIIIRHPDHALSVSFYRGREAGPFLSADVAKVEQHMPTLAAAVERHYALTCPGPVDDVADITLALARLPLPNPLSQREAAVCARILMGYSNEAAAIDLDISFHSVATYRRRAYAKLNITSQNELFALMLTNGKAGRARRAA